MEEMAIIRKPGYGARDMHDVGLFFDVLLADGCGALQVLFGKDAENVLKKVYSVETLNGKACLVQRDGNRVQFIRLLDI